MRYLLLAVALSLTLAGCGGEAAPESAPERPALSSSAASSTDESWPPSLPPDVPTAGEHAWRATWTPDPDAEQQYLASLREDRSLAEFTDDELVRAGYAVCAFYYDGVEGGAPVDAMAGAGKYDVMQAVGIDLAARHRFCMNIDPYGDSY